MEKAYDIVGIGGAIVDILAKVDETFIDEHQLQRGGMVLVDEPKAAEIYQDFPAAIEASGGSVANSLAGIASFGGKAAFIGKVKNDQFGTIFAHDLRAIGVDYFTEKAQQGPATAQCLISVTPDAQRTMATFLGATRLLSSADIDEALLKSAKVVYLEGYMWDEENAKQALRKAVDIVSSSDNEVAFTLSDTFCVERHHAEFCQLIKGVDILFSNEQEIKALAQEDDVMQAAQKIAPQCSILVVTMSDKGSKIFSNGAVIDIEPQHGLDVVDTTGAGDLYAAGFLFGYTQGMPLEECGKLGTVAASEVIQHMGARPQIALSELLDEAA